MEVHEDRAFVCDRCIRKFMKRDTKEKEVKVVTVWKPSQKPIERQGRTVWVVSLEDDEGFLFVALSFVDCACGRYCF